VPRFDVQMLQRRVHRWLRETTPPAAEKESAE
jgi:hypothetical protein